MATTESKNALMARLRSERRWDEACQFREQARQRLLGEGVNRAGNNSVYTFPYCGNAWNVAARRA